ncbi:MAG: lysozyme [Pseudomonadota bacterium]|nr:lysozyme [Pseudomonadota bacterium]
MMVKRWHKLALSGAGTIVIFTALVSYFEPSRTPTVAYRDVTGIWTNCNGNTHGVDPKEVVTPSMCAEINRYNEEQSLAALNRLVTVPLTSNQKAAFSDIIFNIGEDKFKHSSMLRLINEGKVMEACKELLRWVYAGGKKLPGLVARRQAEFTICITPT